MRNWRRAGGTAAAAAAALGLALACSSPSGPATSGSTSGTSGAPSTPTALAVRLKGVVAAGTDRDVAGFRKHFLASEPMGNKAPLAEVRTYSGGGLADVAPIPGAQALTSASPLVGAGGLLVGSGGLLVGSGGLLVGNSGGAYRTMAEGSGEAVAFVEAVDLATGILMARVHPDQDGRFSLDLPVEYAGAVGIQAVAVKGDQVTALLAATTPVRAAAAASDVEVTPGSTLVAFSSALLSGVRSELNVATGFRGFKSGGLKKLVEYSDEGATARAVRAIDTATAHSQPATFDEVLAKTADTAGVLARETLGTASRAGGTAATLTASSNLILAKLPERITGNVPVESAIAAAAAEVKVEEVAGEAGRIEARAQERADDLKTPVIQASATPVPTPRPTPSPTPIPSPTPTPTPTPTATPAPQAASLRVLAGGGTAGYQDGKGEAALFNAPSGLAVTSAGEVYVADTQSFRVRRIGLDGTVSTIAGDGVSRIADGTGLGASFYAPQGMALAGSVLFVAEPLVSRIRRIAAGLAVTTLIGESGAGFQDGSFSQAQVNGAAAVAVAVESGSNGPVYVADTKNHRVRKITLTDPGAVSTVAGGTKGYLDATGTAARFSGPKGLAIGADGKVYVADTDNRRIRTIAASSQAVQTLAGTGFPGYDDGPGASASFTSPQALAVDQAGNLFVADGAFVRLVKPSGQVLTVLGGQDGKVVATTAAGTASIAFAPAALAAGPDATLYMVDAANHRVLALRTAD